MAKHSQPPSESPPQPPPICNFCKKAKDEVEWMVAGPGLHICNECADVATEAIEERRAQKAQTFDAVRELSALTLRRFRGLQGKDKEEVQQRIDGLVKDLMPRRRRRPGDTVAGYSLVRIVGSGNFATVWEGASYEADFPKAAVKLFDVEKLGLGIMLWRFRRGIKAMQHLSSLPEAPESVVRLYNIERDELAFSMQYLSGGDLSNLEQRGWALDKKLDCFRRVCTAVSFAHRNGIIHRDIKPANVVLDEVGHAVLTDFDIADLLFAPTKSIQSAALGTPQFAAPEQLGASAVDAKPTADVYSLGKLLFFLLKEAAPPLGSTEGLHRPAYLAALPDAYTAIVSRAIQHRASDRYATVDDLMEAVATVSNATSTEGVMWMASRTSGHVDPVTAEERTRSDRATTSRSNVKWPPTTLGAIFATVSVLYLITLTGLSLYGVNVSPQGRPLVALTLALSVSLATALLGGKAGASGRLPLPFAKDHPVELR